MCGFVGAVFKRPLDGTEAHVFAGAARTLRHRGPDAAGIAVVAVARAVLGFQRLSIIDLAGGDQPMAIPGHHIVFNGEIYNYHEIREELDRAEVTFKTVSDTEVLLRLLSVAGPAGLDQVRGMFAFAHIDVESGLLTLARDRLGVKQLYVATRPEGVFFASEPKALLALPWIPSRLDPARLGEYFAFRSVPAPGTLYADIAKVRAGSYLQFSLDGEQLCERQYWSLGSDDQGPAGANEQEAILDTFEHVFLTAIQRRLVSDVPVGAFLSGGLDSSLIVAGVSRLGHTDVQTFSATFPGSRDDEASFSAAVSRRFGMRQHTFPLDPANFLTALPRWFELNDDPVADASSLPLLGIADVAREQGRIVMLSGEGADELFGGYGSYHKYLGLRALGDVIPSMALRGLLADGLVAAGLVPGQDAPRVQEYFVRKSGYLGTAALMGTPELVALLGADLQPALENLPRCDRRSLAALGVFDFRRRIPDDLLVRTDRATMGASVEARVPFLDHDLVEFTSRLPAHHRSLPGVSKVLLRRLAHRWGVPAATVLHRKIGFQLPIGAWFRGPLQPAIKTVLERRSIKGINYEYVAGIAEAHLRRRGSYEEFLWRTLTLEAWNARWIERNPIFAPTS